MWEGRRVAVPSFLQSEFSVPVGVDVRRLIKSCQTVNYSDIQPEPLPVGAGSIFRRTIALAACRLADDIFGAPGIIADQL